MNGKVPDGPPQGGAGSLIFLGLVLLSEDFLALASRTTAAGLRWSSDLMPRALAAARSSDQRVLAPSR